MTVLDRVAARGGSLRRGRWEHLPMAFSISEARRKKIFLFQSWGTLGLGPGGSGPSVSSMGREML